MNKQQVLKQLETAIEHGGITYNIAFKTATKFIRDAGKHDFFIADELGGYKKSLYIMLYNKDGYFFDNHLWGFYDENEIAKIFYNIIKEIKQ